MRSAEDRRLKELNTSEPGRSAKSGTAETAVFIELRTIKGHVNSLSVMRSR